MTTSQYGGLVAWDSANRLVAADPLDTGLVNDVVRNNLAHECDRQSQAQVAWLSQSSGAYETWQTAADSPTNPSPVVAYDLFLHPRPNGKPPIFVVDLMGAWGSNSGTVYFIVGIYGPGDLPYDLAGTGPVAHGTGIDAVTFSFASSTPAWGTTQTLEFNALKTVDSLRVPFSGAGSIYSRIGAAGAPASVDLLYARVEVWAYASSKSTIPHLNGLVVREFCGPGT